ncbi:unnamed protein product [Trichobilharzia regenti]|nr:unnamed protein product [Trichobilharzia regenti]
MHLDLTEFSSILDFSQSLQQLPLSSEDFLIDMLVHLNDECKLRPSVDEDECGMEWVYEACNDIIHILIIHIVSLTSLIHENRLTLILTRYLLIDARVKRLIELISRKHAEEAVYMQNTSELIEFSVYINVLNS